MPTILSHPAVALGLWPYFRSRGVTAPILAAGAFCTIAPDFDSLGLAMGVPYGAPLGHRGFTHSLVFAVILGASMAGLSRRWKAGASFGTLSLYFTLCTASHGGLDAFTDGGLGVAFLSPFSQERFFAPWRPIAVAPISPSGLFSERSLPLLASETLWVWIPSLVLFAVGLWRHEHRA